MKPFEFMYLALSPFLMPLNVLIRQRLRQLVKRYPYRPEFLDVGGRKSPYTIGVPANITVTDLPRETDIQHQLNLGVTSAMMKQLQSRRSNVAQLLLDDMTHSQLPNSSYDVVIAVEVLEHVEEDELFVKEVCRVLRPGGVFLMTTPNGEHVENKNPDHKRHYSKEQLQSILNVHFPHVKIEYGVKDSVFRYIGAKHWSIRRPLRTVSSVASNLINLCQSLPHGLRAQNHGTCHLIALATKSSSG